MATSVSYNILNLPSEVKFNDGHIVRYTYDAAGTKLKVEYLLGYIRVMDDWNTDRQPGKDVGGIKGINGISAKGFGGIGDLVSPPGSGMKEPVTQMTLQYSAGHVYRNGKLERVDNPYGYWADGSFHYHITDYQGNIRAVIDEDGTLEEVNNYYPYGGLMGAGAMGVQPYKYGAKELDRENGLDLYDSHARFYDSMIGRTPTQDPLAEKYSGVSPYLWCAGNPVKYSDPDGNDVAVLHYNGQHIALLISQDNKTWYYYSINGNNVYSSGSGTSSHGSQKSGDSSFSGGSKNNDVHVGPFYSVSSFLNSDYNREHNGYNYDRAFVIKTTDKEAKKVEETFTDISETNYSLNPFSPNHCGTAVMKSLESIGIETKTTEFYSIDPMTNIYGIKKTNPYFPSLLYYNIVSQNKGYYVKQKKQSK